MGNSWLTLESSVIPSITGILISASTISGGIFRICSRASSPFLAVAEITQPIFSQSTKNLIPDKIMVSSSTIITLYMFRSSFSPFFWYAHRNSGADAFFTFVKQPVSFPVYHFQTFMNIHNADAAHGILILFPPVF